MSLTQPDHPSSLTSSIAAGIDDVWTWINTPLTTPLTLVEIAMIVATIGISIIVWNMLLYHIRIAAETL